MNSKKEERILALVVCALFFGLSIPVFATNTPILDFNLRQGSGTTITDSANGIVATTHGTVWSTDPSGRPVLYFDNSIKYWFGDGDYVEIPYHDALNSPNITIEIWVYPMSCGAYTQFATRLGDGGGPWSTNQIGPVLALRSPTVTTCSGPVFMLAVGGVHKRVFSPTEILNEWHHIVGTYDGDDMKLYVDGEHVNTTSGVSGPRDTASTPYYLGHYPSGNAYYNGYFARFKMYDRALSADEVAYNFIHEFEGIDQELVVLVEINPNTLNMKSKGNWITCYIELPEAYDVSDIDVDRILLEGLLEVQHSDVQDDVLMVKFDRQDVIAYIELVLEIELPADVTLMVTGELTDGTPFEGSDTIRVIDEGEEE